MTSSGSRRARAALADLTEHREKRARRPALPRRGSSSFERNVVRFHDDGRDCSPRSDQVRFDPSLEVVLWGIMALTPARVRARICVSPSVAWGTEWATLRRWAHAQRKRRTDPPRVGHIDRADRADRNGNRHRNFTCHHTRIQHSPQPPQSRFDLAQCVEYVVGSTHRYRRGRTILAKSPRAQVRLVPKVVREVVRRTASAIRASSSASSRSSSRAACFAIASCACAAATAAMSGSSRFRARRAASARRARAVA